MLLDLKKTEHRKVRRKGSTKKIVMYNIINIKQ